MLITSQKIDDRKSTTRPSAAIDRMIIHQKTPCQQSYRENSSFLTPSSPPNDFKYAGRPGIISQIRICRTCYSVKLGALFVYLLKTLLRSTPIISRLIRGFDLIRANSSIKITAPSYSTISARLLPCLTDS